MTFYQWLGELVYCWIRYTERPTVKALKDSDFFPLNRADSLGTKPSSFWVMYQMSILDVAESLASLVV